MRGCAAFSWPYPSLLAHRHCPTEIERIRRMLDVYRKVHPHANAFECTLPANLRSAVLPNEKCYCEQDSLTIWTSLTFISPVSELSFVAPAACAMVFVPSFAL